MRFDIDHPDLVHLTRWIQDGVVSRPQLLELGATPNDIKRLLRRRDLTVVHPGVYVNHTGAPTRAQREWVAVHAAWPAALTRLSALPDPPGQVIQVAVASDRTVQMPERSVAFRTAQLDARVDWRAAPPRMRIEHALIDVMSDLVDGGDVAGAYAVLTRVAHTRRTGAEEVLRVLDGRARVPGRTTILGMLADLRDGACSVLERGYVHHVERPHGLPRGTRQQRSTATGGPTDRDVTYKKYRTIVELDGRAYHQGAIALDRDARRDLAELAVSDQVTARVTYGLVFANACQTAEWIGSLLHRNGWPGPLLRCPNCG